MNNCLLFLADRTFAKTFKEMCQEKNPCLSTEAFSQIRLSALEIAKQEGGNKQYCGMTIGIKIENNHIEKFVVDLGKRSNY